MPISLKRRRGIADRQGLKSAGRQATGVSGALVTGGVTPGTYAQEQGREQAIRGVTTGAQNLLNAQKQAAEHQRTMDLLGLRREDRAGREFSSLQALRERELGLKETDLDRKNRLAKEELELRKKGQTADIGLRTRSQELKDKAFDRSGKYAEEGLKLQQGAAARDKERLQLDREREMANRRFKGAEIATRIEALRGQGQAGRLKAKALLRKDLKEAQENLAKARDDNNPAQIELWKKRVDGLTELKGGAPAEPSTPAKSRIGSALRRAGTQIAFPAAAVLDTSRLFKY